MVGVELIFVLVILKFINFVKIYSALQDNNTQNGFYILNGIL